MVLLHTYDRCHEPQAGARRICRPRGTAAWRQSLSRWTQPRRFCSGSMKRRRSKLSSACGRNMSAREPLAWPAPGCSAAALSVQCLSHSHQSQLAKPIPVRPPPQSRRDGGEGQARGTGTLSGSAGCWSVCRAIVKHYVPSQGSRMSYAQYCSHSLEEAALSSR